MLTCINLYKLYPKSLLCQELKKALFKKRSFDNHIFGDMWKYKIQLEEIRPADQKMTRAVIIESRGQAPEQYNR